MSTSDQINSIELSPALTPVLSDRFVARWSHVAVTATYAIVFLLISYLPISSVESWQHLNQGRWILSQQALPVAAPGLSLAEGMPYQNHQWLSEIILAKTHQWWGAEGLGNLNAVTCLAVMVLLAVTAFQLCRSKALAVFTMLISLAAIWPELNLISPRMFTLLMLAATLALLTHIRFRCRNLPDFRHGVALCIGMALWANLDASFMIGIFVLASVAIGRVIDLLGRRRSLMAVFEDVSCRRWIWIFELAIVATWGNPNGYSIYTQLFSRAGNSVLSSLGGLQPLNPMTWSGVAVIALVWLTMVALRYSNRRLAGSQMICLGAGMFGVIFNQSLVLFFAPIAVMSLLPHLRSILRRQGWLRNESKNEVSASDYPAASTHQSHKFALSLICVLFVWIGFSLSPLSRPFLGGKGRSAEQLYDAETPLGVAAFLHKCDPEAFVWAPAYWGDWINWTQGPEVEVFANSNSRLLPQQVKFDYGLVFRGEASFERTLDRYQVDLLVADKARQTDLIKKAASGQSAWKMVYEDRQAAIFARRDASLNSGRSRS
ncbi:MAG: hypothetical protein VYE28_12805 [Planctomycetota bacterium]|nr:hypothetical protein [Planctomycetota bacterium]